MGFVALACAAGLCATVPALVQAGESAKLFRQSVQPLLTARCFSCHGPDEQEGALRLDSRAALLKGGKQGPSVVPGKPQESLLLRAVLHETKQLAMPPKEKLPASDIAALTDWIQGGAAWPDDAPSPPSVAPSASDDRIGDAWHDSRNPIVRIFRGERLDLWSLKPVTDPPLPGVQQSAWLRNEIDTFVLQQFEAAALQPSAEADRRTLARRLHFDLTGLPPTPEEMAAFVADERPDSYERLVDRLLASPRHGEHAARQWLDAVRYSDSNGFDWDEFRPQAWRFRDFVIRSLNADKPFDQFLTEQLAGDELLTGPPQNLAEQDMMLAVGYLRVGPQDNSSALFNEQARSRAEWMADLVETTGSAFLGLTFSCCRCHDHKYDPLSQADHFRLRAFFEPLKYADELSIDLAADQQAIAEHNATLDAQAEPLNKQRAALREQAKTRLTAKDGKASEEQLRAVWTEAERAQDKQLEQQLQALKVQRRSPSKGLLATDAAGDAPMTHVLYQGDHKAEREAVAPGFISALDPNAATILPAPNPATKGRRLTLARWIAAPENPLTARVLANRLWQSHFGRGLVETSNDFGLAGERPSHPELLDWLAGDVVRDRWSLKDLRRSIVSSATYRQASSASPSLLEHDPDNRLLARQNLRRLTAEQLRDALLAASGLLNGKAAGPPVWPELPPEVLQANPAFLDDNGEKTKGWYPSPAHQQGARSIFLVQKRTVRVPFLETFDLPENQTSCARRNTSTVAPQAFSLLNSPLAIQAATTFAERVQAQAGDEPESQITAAFAAALQRPPNQTERAACLQLLQTRNLTELCRALLNLNEFVYID